MTATFNLDQFADAMLVNLGERLDWEKYHMACAILVGSRSSCSRLHVGCVIINEDQRLVSAGYNGFLAKAPHVSVVRHGHEQATVHAEQNAIANAANNGTSVAGATAYITHRPCINCAKILAAAGIKKIIYHRDYPDELVATILKNADVELVQINGN